EPVQLPVDVWFPGARADFRRDDVARLEAAVKTADTDIAKALARAQLDALLARIAADDVRFGGKLGDEKALSRAASKAEVLAALRAAEEKLALAEQARANPKLDAVAKVKAQQQETAAQKAVDAAKKALEADSTTYTSLSPVFPTSSTGRRKALAGW